MYRTNSYSNDPREIEAKFNGICAETGKEIKKGDLCVYYPSSKKVYHTDSKQAAEFRAWKMSLSLGLEG